MQSRSGKYPKSRPKTLTQTSCISSQKSTKPPLPNTIFSIWGISFYSRFPLYLSPGNPSPSTLRKAQDSLSDPKYSGKRVSRTQLLDDDGQSPSDSEVEDPESEDENRVAQIPASDSPEPAPQQEAQLDVAQTMSQTRQDDQKKGLAVSRQLVRPVYHFSHNNLML